MFPGQSLIEMCPPTFTVCVWNVSPLLLYVYEMCPPTFTVYVWNVSPLLLYVYEMCPHFYCMCMKCVPTFTVCVWNVSPLLLYVYEMCPHFYVFFWHCCILLFGHSYEHPLQNNNYLSMYTVILLTDIFLEFRLNGRNINNTGFKMFTCTAIQTEWNALFPFWTLSVV